MGIMGVLAVVLFVVVSLLSRGPAPSSFVDGTSLSGGSDRPNNGVANLVAVRHGRAYQDKTASKKIDRDKTTSEKGSTPYVVGERANYDISWSNFIVAGELTLQTKERVKFEGREAFHVSAQAESVGLVKALNYRLNDKYESYVDASSLLPFRGTKISHHGKRVAQSSFVVDQNGHTATLSDGKALELPKDTYDMASVLFAIRGISQAPGASKSLNVIDDGKVYPIRVEAEGREKVYTRAATYDAFRIAVKMIEGGKASDAHKIRIYLTRDSQRVPVLITAEPPWGQIRIELTGKSNAAG
jgi:hypothetical protein